MPSSKAFATTIFFSANESWSTVASFRLGALGWSPAGQSYFVSGYEATGALSQVGCPRRRRRGVLVMAGCPRHRPPSR